MLSVIHINITISIYGILNFFGLIYVTLLLSETLSLKKLGGCGGKPNFFSLVNNFCYKCINLDTVMLITCKVEYWLYYYWHIFMHNSSCYTWWEIFSLVVVYKMKPIIFQYLIAFFLAKSQSTNFIYYLLNVLHMKVKG